MEKKNPPVFRIGTIALKVDPAKTKRLYRWQPRPDESMRNQAWRNFYAYLETELSDEEKRFFDAFGIDPFKPECLIGLQFNRKGPYLTDVVYPVIGSAQTAGGDALPEESLCHDPDIAYLPVRVGCFKWEINREIRHNKWGTVYRLRGRMPDTPWLLSERIDEDMEEGYVPPSWSLFHRLKRRIQYRYFTHRERWEWIQEYRYLLSKHGIAFRKMPKWWAVAYRRRWLRAYCPPFLWKKAVPGCLKNKKYSVYLWHLFGIADMRTLQYEKAEKAFESQEHHKGVLLLEDIKIAFKLRQANPLSLAVLDVYNGDISFTASDFSWTYQHTHERGWFGPYFYPENLQKSVPGPAQEPRL